MAWRRCPACCGRCAPTAAPDGLAPQPTLAQLDALVAQVAAAGLPVDLRIGGTPRPLPAGVDLSAYRVAQEALTNTLKHAGPARAQLTVRYTPDTLEITATDTGANGAAGEPAGAGRGTGWSGCGSG